MTQSILIPNRFATFSAHPGIQVPVIDPAKLMFGTAKKTKNIIGMTFEDAQQRGYVPETGIIRGLEGELTGKPGDWYVRGIIGEPWFQSEAKLFGNKGKYAKLDGTDENGFFTFAPLPDNATYACRIDFPQLWAIQGLWGEQQEDGTYMQRGFAGDLVMQNITDPSDNYRIVSGLFEATYDWVAAPSLA